MSRNGAESTIHAHQPVPSPITALPTRPLTTLSVSLATPSGLVARGGCGGADFIIIHGLMLVMGRGQVRHSFILMCTPGDRTTLPRILLRGILGTGRGPTFLAGRRARLMKWHRNCEARLASGRPCRTGWLMMWLSNIAIVAPTLFPRVKTAANVSGGGGGNNG